MKILLLGSNGQLGSDIHKEITVNSDGIEVLPFTRNDLDISDLEKIQPTLSEISFDVLINCTSFHKTDEVESNGNQAFTVNSHAPQIFAQVCQKKGARLFHISTDYVFNGQGKQPYLEQDIPGPLNVYGASKLMGEQLVLNSHGNHLILRVASLFGVSGASGKGGNFVETMIRCGKEKGLLKVVDDITMSPTSTKDLANSIHKMLKDPPDSGIYHVVNSGQATWFEFAEDIIKQASVNAKVLPVTSQEYKTKALRPSYSVLSTQKLAGVMDALPHWKESLERYLKEKGHR